MRIYTVKTEECQMVCDICGQEGIRIRRVARIYGKGEDLLVIENIPVVSCLHLWGKLPDSGHAARDRAA